MGKLVFDRLKTIATTLETAILDSLSACLRFSLQLNFSYLLIFYIVECYGFVYGKSSTATAQLDTTPLSNNSHTL